MNQQGLQFARIHLHPSDLGPIDISLDQRDGGLVVSMSAQHPMTRDLLEQHAPRMREQLAADGARVDRFDVSDGSAGSAQQRDDQRRNDSRRGPDDNGEASESRPIRLQLKGSGLFEAYA